MTEAELAQRMYETEPPPPGVPSGGPEWDDLPSSRRMFWHDWAHRLAAIQAPTAPPPEVERLRAAARDAFHAPDDVRKDDIEWDDGA